MEVVCKREELLCDCNAGFVIEIAVLVDVLNKKWRRTMTISRMYPTLFLLIITSSTAPAQNGINRQAADPDELCVLSEKRYNPITRA